MNEEFDNPELYTHVFYQKNIWKIVVSLSLMIPLSFGVIFLDKYFKHHRTFSWQEGAGIVFLALLFIIPIIIYRFFQIKKLQVGIGPAGVYVRSHGLLPWTEIKKIELWRHAKHGKSIKIIMYSPAEQAGKILPHGAGKKALFDMLGAGQLLDEKFIYATNYLSISLEELFSLLRKYHATYQQKVCSEDAAVYAPARTISYQLIRLALAVLIGCGFAFFSIKKSGTAGIWIGIGVGTLIAASLFFRMSRWMPAFVEKILFVFFAGLTVLSSGWFVYKFIVYQHFELNVLLSGGFCLIFLIFLIVSRRRHEKIQE
jgi:hypothetical protein